MSATIVGVIGFVILFLLFFLGLPVGISMAVIGALGLWYLLSPAAAMSKIAILSFSTISSYDMAVLPLFLLMAFVILYTRLGSDLFNLASKWVGHLPGGLAMATIGGSAMFAAIAADNISPATTMSLVAFPEMERFKYNQSLSVGAIAVGGSLGILIPPSACMITYGILTETSIGKLFISGIVPGLMMALLYAFTIYFFCRWNPQYGPPGPRFSFKEKVIALARSGEVLLIILFILVGILVGWFTPTEAGAAGAFMALFFALIRKRLSWKIFKDAVWHTIKMTGMVYCMQIGAFVFMNFSAASRIPTLLANFVSDLAVPPVVIILCIILIYLVLGCIMDGLAMILCTIPVFFPVIQALEMDPVWFGIMIVLMMMTAIITPPVGINLFVISAACKVPLTSVYKGVLPFIIANAVIVALLLFFPQIVSFLPNLMN